MKSKQKDIDPKEDSTSNIDLFADVLGERYDTPRETVSDDIQDILKGYAEDYDTVISGSNKTSAKFNKLIDAESLSREQSEYIKRLFPNIKTDLDALQLVNYLLTVELYDYNSWFQITTRGDFALQSDILRSILTLPRLP